MSISLKSASLGVAMLAAVVTVANARADAAEPMQQVAQTAGAAAGAVTLPEVVVHPSSQPGWYYDPYTSGRAQRPSSLNHIPFQHYKAPIGYDAAVAMHPYTSGFGPCTEGASPAQGCRHPTGNPYRRLTTSGRRSTETAAGRRSQGVRNYPKFPDSASALRPII